MADIAKEDFVPLITCDRCVAPGTCCKAFPLNVDIPSGTPPEKVMDIVHAKPGNESLPFLALRREYYWPSSEGWYERWLFTCPKLGEGGRCTIYDSRPKTCKVYEPGCDQMCVHMRLPDGRPIVPLLPAPVYIDPAKDDYFRAA